MPVTWDPATISAGLVLSNGNLTATAPASLGNYSAKSTVTGTKFYFETIVNIVGAGGAAFGVSDSSFTSGDTTVSAHAVGAFTDVNVYLNSGVLGQWTAVAPVNGDNCSCAVDIANHLIWFRKNGGNWNNSGTANPATGTGGFSIASITSPVNAIVDCRQSAQETAQFASASWTYAAPSGFVQLAPPVTFLPAWAINKNYCADGVAT